MQKRLPKFRRVPEAVQRRQITDRSVAIIAVIARYRFIPTSLLVALVAGNEDVTHRHLQRLYHRALVNRFSFPRIGAPGEFIYYLDNPDTLKLLVRLPDGKAGQELDWEEVRNNREKNYASADVTSGQFLFLDHELMVSRFHAMLELACRHRDGEVELAAWRQGAELHERIEVPKVSFGEGKWIETDDSERLPHRPDAFFTLHFPQAPEGAQHAHFFYEADRKTTSTKKMVKKLRAHFHFVVRQRRHQEKYQIRRLRAVLVETLDVAWAEALREAARHPIVSGAKPSPLFWFTASELFTKEREVQQSRGVRALPRFLVEPDLIFKKVWATPLTPASGELVSLLD